MKKYYINYVETSKDNFTKELMFSLYKRSKIVNTKHIRNNFLEIVEETLNNTIKNAEFVVDKIVFQVGYDNKILLGVLTDIIIESRIDFIDISLTKNDDLIIYNLEEDKYLSLKDLVGILYGSGAIENDNFSNKGNKEYFIRLYNELFEEQDL